MFRSAQAECQVCKTTSQGLTIYCDQCHKTVHTRCVDLPREQLLRILNYYCTKCENSLNILTQWRRKTGSSEKMLDKRSNYYAVEKIIKHIVIQGIRFFYVKWEGYPQSENSWVNEEGMDGAIDMMQKYLRDKELPLSKVTGLMGAHQTEDTLDNFDTRNWLSMTYLLEEFKKFSSQRSIKTDISFQEWSGFGTADSLYFLSFDGHCYVLMYYYSRELCYIADGNNIFRTDQEIAQSIKQLLNVRLISLIYEDQVAVDHCVSSAILIGIELLRSYKSGVFPMRLNSSVYWRKRLAKQLHRFRSRHVGKPLIEFRRRHKCACNISFSSRRALNLHLSKCTQR